MDLGNGLCNLLVFSLNDLPGIPCRVFDESYLCLPSLDRACISADFSS